MSLAKISTAITAPVRNNRTFFPFMYLLGAVCVLFEPYDGSRFIAMFQLFADLYIICAALLLFPQKVRRYVRGVLYVLLYLPAIIDTACYARFGTPVIPIYVELLQHTDAREASEALSSYLSWKMLVSPLGGILLVLSAHVAYAFIRHKSVRIYPPALQEKLHSWPAAAAVTAVFSFGFFSTLDSKEYIYYRVVKGLDELEVQRIKDFSPKTKYYIPAYRLAYALSENRRLNGTRQALFSSFQKAEVTACSHTSPCIVLIIGESCNRHHSPLYGYDKATAPFLIARMQKGELAVFTDAVSSWNVTCESFENMLSTHCVGMKGGWASYPLFPQLFRLAGYRTAFYSNQFVMNGGGSSAFKEDLFINHPALSGQMFDYRNDRTHEFDLGLTGDFRQAPDTIAPELHIFHFLGVHVDFRQRFPQNAALFKATDYRRPDLTDNERQILADYDNALRYNDYVTDSILRLFEHKDAIVVFLSDHGERVFDRGTKEWGRSLVWNAANVSQQYDIPFWIYASPAYRRKHPDLWKRINDARHRRLMTDALPHLLLYLAGIQSPWYSERHNILSDEYEERRPRLLNGERDYDAFFGQ